MARILAAYEAKTRFAELLREVRAGKSVVISYHGKPVAELRPFEAPSSTAAAVDRLESSGVLVPPKRSPSDLVAVAERPGALARFLASRDRDSDTLGPDPS